MKLSISILPLLVATVGCSSPGTDLATDLSPDGKADGFGLDRCFAAATDAVLTLEAANGTNRLVQEGKYLHGFRERAIWQFDLADEASGSTTDRVMVSTRSVSNGCQVAGLALASEYLPIYDDGFERIQDAPVSDSCKAPIAAMVETFAELSGTELEIWRWELVNAHSDHELIRVHAHSPDWSWAPEYIVNAETFGGDPCSVYSMQTVLEQLYLTNDRDDINALNAVRDLQNMVIDIATEYSELGDDNNWVSYETVMGVGEPGFSHPSHPADGGDVEDYTDAGFSILADVAGECAFMRDGSYGDHLSRSKQKKIAGKFVAAYYAIRDQWGADTRFERITHYRVDQGGYWVAPCTVRIAVPSVGIDILMDSASVD